MVSSSPNLYATIAEQIRSKVLSTPPASYKSRIIGLWVLCGIKLALAIAYMVLTYLDLRKRGKRLRLVRVQRLQHGKIWIFNSLFLYVLISAVGAIYLAIVRYKTWTIYYGSGSPVHLTMFIVQQWTPTFLAAFIFTTGNCCALLMMSRKARGFESASRAGILLMNISLVAMLVIYFGSLLPVSILANAHVNSVIGEGIALMIRLEQASAAVSAGLSPSSALDGMGLSEILAKVQDLQVREDGLQAYIYGLLAIAVFFCVVFATAALYALRFVLMLRRESRRSTHIGHSGKPGDHALQSIAVTREETVVVDDACSFFEGESKIPLRPLPSYSPNKTVKSPYGSSKPFANAVENKSAYVRATPLANAEAVALKRLVADLLLSVPCVLVACFVLPTCAFWGWLDPGKTWIDKELELDGLAWPELILTNIILAFFVWNLIVHPTRYAHQSSDEVRTLGARTAPPGFEFRLNSAGNASTVHHVYVNGESSYDGEISLADAHAREAEKEW